MNKRILNLTQHKPTEEQIYEGVVEFEVNPEFNNKIKEILTFKEIPTPKTLKEKAEEIAAYAKIEAVEYAMIGGAPFFMSHLERALKSIGIKPIYAFSIRESQETEKDGKIIKTNIFKHIGFVGLD